MTRMPDDNHQPLDFGSDPDRPATTDPAFDAWIARMAPRINAPPATPAAEMWEAIAAAGAAAREADAGRIPGIVPLRRGGWRLLALVAAALVIGIVTDRTLLRRDRPAAAPAVAERTPAAPDGSARPDLYRLAATQTLSQADALLTAYRSERARGDTASLRQLGAWGRDLLGSTRLLMDSPAGADPRLRALLDDLELVLVQIVQLSGAELGPDERALIDRALEERDLLPRIRTAVPAGPAATTQTGIRS